MKNNFSILGKPIVRQDGLEKVTGKAKFGNDYNFPGQLYGVMVRIPVAHAKIKSIDYSGLQNNPAIKTICDASDIPGEKNVGPTKKDQPIFSSDKIVTPGDVVAMLVGENEEELLKLRHLVKIDYESLLVLTDPTKAMDEDAILIHPEFPNNEIIHHPLRKGNIEKGFSESDFIIEQTYSTQLVEHAYIEPEVVIAIPLEGNKGIKIIGSIQNPHTTRKIVAMALNWQLTKVRVIQAELGGSFGGKDDTMNILSARAAVAAIKTGKPVKIRYRREESILESYKRHPYIMNYKVGVAADGKIKAMKINIIADGGAYASMSPFVTWRTVVQATGPYEIENVWTDVRAVYTNNPYTGAMRGFGSPQPIFAQESLMDDLAIKLGITPEDIRRINGLKIGSITATGQKLENHDINLIKVMETAIEQTDYTKKWLENSFFNQSLRIEERFKVVKDLNIDEVILEEKDFIAPDNLFKKGIGLAVSFRGCSLGAEGIDAAAAYLSVQSDGSVYLLSGLAENGQGLRTTFSIIAAEALGISVENIFYLELDTGIIPDSGPTVASRSTLMGGGAVKSAAEIIRERFKSLLIEEWKLAESDDLIFENNLVYIKENSETQISFSELCSLASKKGISLAAIGWYEGPKVGWDEETGQGDAYFTYVYGCQVAEVTVNVGTGEVYLDKVTAVHDPGKVINLLGAKGQVYGGVTQGAGYALWEEVSSHEGFIRELNFDQYLIPTSKDVGEIIPVFVEGEDNFGAWGGKSLGEPTLELTSAAIVNAIRNATGKRYFQLPLNLEEIILRRKLHPEDLKRGSTK
ncbi:MAG: xanthine dehydrogenase family protein molybdopterin-binding subunit [Ignavibacteriales bacterium]|nr:xanthine dehydrogenase family protein molybdopterin-binding subunit [Ignavibacteriales bacterium]